MTHLKFSAGFGMMFILLILYGCAGSGIKPNPDNPIKTVAVLPMVNNTNDVEAPAKVRQMFYEKLQAYHYQVKSLKETDEVLNHQMGITLGKQLEMTTAQQLGEKLGVDGVIYGYLINFDETVTGVYNMSKVRMGWKLVDTKSGAITWGRGIAVKSDAGTGTVGAIASAATGVTDSMDSDVGKLPSSADPMKEMPGLDKWVVMESTSSSGSYTSSLLSSVGGALADSVMGTGLKEETEYALNKVFPKMLVGPGS